MGSEHNIFRIKVNYEQVGNSHVHQQKRNFLNIQDVTFIEEKSNENKGALETSSPLHQGGHRGAL